MNIPQAMEEKILDYLDGVLSEKEKTNLEQQIRDNAVLKARFETLRSLHALLANETLEQPSQNFTHHVMARLDHSPGTSTATMRNGILLLCSSFIVIIVAALLLSVGVFDGSVVDLKELNLLPGYIAHKLIPNSQFSGKIMVQIIIFLNLVLGWMVLDRAVLKPFFKKRMEVQG